MASAIEVLGIHKKYQAVHALAGIDLSIEQGEFFALLGPNGAGKTTLISVIAGLARPSQGAVRVMGHDVVRNYRAARRALGVVPQELVFDPFFTVRETLRIQSGYFGIRRNDAWIDEVMERLDLGSRADFNMRALSGGMKRRVLVAQALVHKPPVIILDEPTAGVDVELRQGLWEFVRQLNADGHTIVLTTHYLQEAENLCTRVGMLKQGRLVALDRTENLLKGFSGIHLHVRVATSGTLPDAVLKNAVQRPDGQLRYALKEYADVEPVLALIRAHSLQISSLELAQPDLEEVFVSIMRDSP
jgi:ABC-2 type transport system ATP-binding protein